MLSYKFNKNTTVELHPRNYFIDSLRGLELINNNNIIQETTLLQIKNYRNIYDCHDIVYTNVKSMVDIQVERSFVFGDPFTVRHKSKFDSLGDPHPGSLDQKSSRFPLTLSVFLDSWCLSLKNLIFYCNKVSHSIRSSGTLGVGGLVRRVSHTPVHNVWIISL